MLSDMFHTSRLAVILQTDLDKGSYRLSDQEIRFTAGVTGNFSMAPYPTSDIFRGPYLPIL
jgi:hypothetical protein